MRAIVVFDETTFNNNETKTMVQLLAGTDHALELTEVSVSFQGVDNLAKPVKIEVLRQTTAGTASAISAVKVGDDSDSIDTGAQQTFTAEPTSGDILRRWFVHPQQGLIYTVPDPSKFKAAGGTRLAMRIIIETGEANLDGTGYMEFEE